MPDIMDIALTSKTSSIADIIMETGYFKAKSDVMTFAAAVVVRDYPNFDPSIYLFADSGGSNYSFSTFDSDGIWSKTIKTLYPDTETPYYYLRAMIVYGLEQIGQKMEESPSFSIVSLL